MWRIVIFVSKHLVMTVNRGYVEEKAMKFATVTAVLLMIIVCVLLPKLPAIHTWAVEREEERIAEAELAEQKITMSDLTIKNTEVADDTEQRQLASEASGGSKGE